MELRQLKYFIEVAKREHVTHAADALHVAQSAVSRQISNLEDELGVQLFIREGRNVKLTPVGKLFLEHIEIAIREIDKAVQEVKEFLDPESGVIRIGFPNSLAANTLPKVISAFREKHPKIRFQLRQGILSTLINSVVKGEIDLAFVAPVPTDHELVDGHILFTEEMMAILPAVHPLTDQDALRLDQLRKEPFVMFRTGFILREIVVNACQQAGFKPHVAFEGEDIDTIKGLVAAGLGVALLPEVTLMDNIPREAIKMRIVEPQVTRTVGVITPKNRDLAPSVKNFFEFLQTFFDNLTRFRL
ncbi:transcriptional regulator, LysR family [Caldalkalibacillus thermarum TA2.A1]|uniref:LysR family transcriptional regulator n=1 Tax=Caldalkalibacillus thermarum (strain TA2.A1) TaxID=986075 RepID=F5L5R1_CALTT|nr:LysR family transcriptional regulator [Caldalkalibacillus thermarum]EGL83340.1 transcriptional regulator, LysR family [Caldalkalibacillus thermarum TA2.A1]QZT32850.1 LysR family transcriptional regulator [Caldalkalibacillus thermarum TA2.A1]GGK14551.1 HTH-type transcriptional regulator GltC [Caldalkalibacillus thermarum]